MTETLAERAERLAAALDFMLVGHPLLFSECQSAAATLRELATANATLATEHNEALAAVTTAEQRAVNADAALEAQRHTYHAAHIALAAEVAALRELLRAAEPFLLHTPNGTLAEMFSTREKIKAALAAGKEKHND